MPVSAASSCRVTRFSLRFSACFSGLRLSFFCSGFGSFLAAGLGSCLAAGLGCSAGLGSAAGFWAAAGCFFGSGFFSAFGAGAGSLPLAR